MAKLYMLTETSEFMMGFVLITDKDNCIIVDGGRPLDMPLLKETVAGRHVLAWILTHAHSDHISGFVDEMQKNGGADFDLEKVYFNMPDYDALINNRNVPDYTYFKSELEEILPKFNAVKEKFADKAHIVTQGESLTVDEVNIEFLYTLHDGLYSNLMNDASLVFKVTTPNTSVLFLGDLGPEGGDVLFSESRGKLRADIVQMAHHGHMNVSMEVYAAIRPKACLWCCPAWLYDEPAIPWYLSDRKRMFEMNRGRMYGTALTREWMDILGAEKHYVTKDGTQIIPL